MKTRERKATAAIDVRSQPAYSLAEAARYLRLPQGTLRSWVVGRGYLTASGHKTFAPLIRPAQKQPLALSFWDLVEAHVLRALRTDHGVPVDRVRQALRYAEAEEGIDKLLLRKDLLAGAGRLFLERYGELVELTASGQLAMQKVFEQHLKRVEWDADRFPGRLYPFVVSEGLPGERSISIDPHVAFGRPTIRRAGVSTQTIAARLDAGETVDELAEDYGLTSSEIESAAVYERAA